MMDPLEKGGAATRIARRVARESDGAEILFTPFFKSCFGH